MVLNLADTLMRKPRKIAVDLPEERIRRENVIVELGCHPIERVQDLVWRIVEAVRNLVDIREPDSRVLQAIRNRLNGKLSRVFSAAEALFPGCGDNFSIHNQRGGGIMPL